MAKSDGRRWIIIVCNKGDTIASVGSSAGKSAKSLILTSTSGSTTGGYMLLIGGKGVLYNIWGVNNSPDISTSTV